jgi:hypothetical protein
MGGGGAGFADSAFSRAPGEVLAFFSAFVEVDSGGADAEEFCAAELAAVSLDLFEHAVNANINAIHNA